jgi:hypothetical protein
MTPLDRARFQLYNTIFPHSHHHWLCILASNEQEPVPVEAIHFLTAAMIALLGKCCRIVHLSLVRNRWKSVGAKSRLYSRRGITVQPNFATCSIVFKLIWGLALPLWGEVSLCDTLPTLIILHVNLVQLFINATRITNDNWSQVTGSWFWRQLQLTRGRVCKLLFNCLWALPEQSLLGRCPAELTALFYRLIWDSTNLQGQVLVFRSHVSAVRNFQCYHWEGCMGSMQCNVEFGYNLSICSGTKENHRKPWLSWPVAGPSECNWLLASSLALNPGTLTFVLTLCCCIFLFCFLFVFLFFSRQVILFLQLFVCAYDLDKHRTVHNTYGRNNRIYEQTRIQTYTYLYLCFSSIIVTFGSLL